MTGQRAVRAGTAGLLTVVLSGGTEPQYCTEMADQVDVRVDTTGLDLPAGTAGRLCVEDECTDLVVGADLLFPEGAYWGRLIPDVETVQVTLTLTDAAGALLWSGSAAVDTEVIEPNGPGCGQTTVLSELRATPDGRLVT